MRCIPTDDQREAVRAHFRDTTLTLQEIADDLRLTYKVVWKVVAESFTLEERGKRKRKNYRRSKTGDLNPMTGKFGAEHPNFKGRVYDGRGYVLVLKPEWYTGRKKSKHVFEHHVVMCEALGLTEMPKGWQVHHINKVKDNNSLDNLALCTKSGHQRIHAREGVTTIPKGSRGAKRSSKRGTTYSELAAAA